MEEMEVEDLEELVRRHEQQRPSEEERRLLRQLHSEIREELLGKKYVSPLLLFCCTRLKVDSSSTHYHLELVERLRI